ncbi:MAG: ArdC-like ssDNA-binding domain-containing protein [Jannaschia sp.]
MTAAKFDVYTHVTNQIVAQIEAGTPPWRKPWTGGGGAVSLPERFNGEAYRGINILVLWATAMAKDYISARWMTFNQARQLGGHVRKGEKSATVVKYGTVEREDETGEERQVPYAKAYRVFNSDQIECLPAEFYILPNPPRDLGTTADPKLEAFFAATGAQIDVTEEPRAYYNIKTDRIHMPPIGTFHRAAGYYGTLAHELTHNAVSRIMPHGRAERLFCLRSAMRRFGIIRAPRGRRPIAAVIVYLSAVSGPRRRRMFQALPGSIAVLARRGAP